MIYKQQLSTGTVPLKDITRSHNEQFWKHKTQSYPIPFLCYIHMPQVITDNLRFVTNNKYVFTVEFNTFLRLSR